MKKFMKLLIATALIVTMAVCFAACGGKTMEKVYDLSGVKATAVATKTGQLNDFTDWKVADHDGEWVVFYEDTLAYKTVEGNKVADPQNDTRTYKLYNAATEKVAASKSVKRGKTGFQLPYSTEKYLGVSVGVEISRLDNEILVKTVYYGETSVSVGAVKQSAIITNDSAKLAKIGDYIFKVVDGVVSHVENATANISSFSRCVNGYYYEFESNGITVYDASLNLYGFVRVPSYASAYPIVLANGNVLIQYQVAQDPYGDDYDAIEVNYNGVAKKSNYETILYNVEKNTAKEIKFDYLVEGVETENLAEKVDNIAYLYEIKDNRVDYNDEAVIVAKLSNNGKVGTIYGKAEDYLVNAEVEAIAENRFLAKSISGEKVLYNEEMEKLATFTSSAYANEQYIVDGNKYYNFDGVLIIDTAEYVAITNRVWNPEKWNPSLGQYGDYDYVPVVFDNGNAIYKKYDENNSSIEYWLLAKGAFTKVATEWEEEVIENKNSGEMFELFGNNYYVVTKYTIDSENGKVTCNDYIYNMNGEKLTETVAYVPYVDIHATEDKGTVIEDRTVVTEAEGLLVFKATVTKFNSAKEDDKVIGYETFTEYYYCK